jgi:hypothetical protein
METKRCIGCGEEKPLDSFYRSKGAKDGRKSRCKPCAHAQTLEWRRANRERHNEYNRKKRAREPGRKREERRRERREQPEKYSARQAVRWALKTGRLVRPDSCEECGKDCTPHAHHPDYSRKLDVCWLCPLCHKAEHRKEAAAPDSDQSSGSGDR